MEAAKQGDVVEWDFKGDDYSHLPDHLRGMTFKGNVAVVFEKQRVYGVYASYGQDYIRFDQCKVIERN